MVTFIPVFIFFKKYFQNWRILFTNYQILCNFSFPSISLKNITNVCDGWYHDEKVHKSHLFHTSGFCYLTSSTKGLIFC